MNCRREYFEDRQDAARQLSESLPREEMKREAWHFVAVSSGGLEVASHLRGRHKFKIDFLFSESIVAPQNSECEIARVSETEEIVINEYLVENFDIQYDYIYGEASRRHEEQILSYMFRHRKGRHFESMEDKNVLLIDEGSETGFKLLVAIKSILAMNPRAVYVAVPILPVEVIDSIDSLVDNVFFVHEIEDYIDTSCYYKNFEPIPTERIDKILGEKE